MSDDSRPPVSRRQVLETGALAAGALFAGCAAGAETPLPQVPRRVLGKTGKKIPILLMGGAMGFDPRFDPRLAEAVKLGVDYVDAADCYAGGRCESSVGAFHARVKGREKLWITSKSDRHDPAGLERTLRSSLSALRTSYVDMYYLHALDDPGSLTPELARTVDRLKKDGAIRHFGFSCHGRNVVALLHKAATLPWVESVMFRFSFRQYGDLELNAAMDAAHRSGVGLIAMKTAGSGLSVEPVALWQGGKWNRHQSALRAAWADARITAAVSHMDTFEKLRENVAAAVDRTALSPAETAALQRFAEATRPMACDGCEQHCSVAVAAPVRIGDTLRCVMYHDVYGEPERAREVFRSLPVAAQRLHGVDFSRAAAACPHGVDVARHMARAREVLAG